MKQLSFLAAMLLTIFTVTSASAQSSSIKKDTVKVWGNCGMCKSKIEKAARTAGATKASWNEETKILAVSYNSGKSSLAKIQQAVAATGYDTRDYTADNNAYSKLHGCCQYDRKETPAKQ